MVIVGELLLAGECQRQRVADAQRTLEVQRLADVDGAGAGKLGAEHGGDQGAPPHAMGDDLVEHRGAGVFRIDQRRIDVAGDDGEHLDVFRFQRARQCRRFTDDNFVEGAVLDVVLGWGHEYPWWRWESRRWRDGERAVGSCFWRGF